MKIKRNNSRTAARAATLVLGLGLVGGGVASTISQVMAADSQARDPISGKEKVYGVDAFDEDYSRGVLYRALANSGSTKYEKVFNGTSTCPASEDYFCGTNSQKSTDIYVTTKKGAIYENQQLDVREYISIIQGRSQANDAMWAFDKTDNTIQISAYNKDGEVLAGDIRIRREIHFYYSDRPEEEFYNFKGVTGFSDFEWGEGYQIVNGYHQAYVKNPTLFKSNGVSSKTWVTVGDGENDPAFVNGDYTLWVEVQSSKADPLILDYISPVTKRGSRNMLTAYNVSYKIDNASYGKPDVVIKNGTFMPQAPTDLPEGKTFDGWYTDAAMTPANKVTKALIITENRTLYGKTTGASDKAKVTTTIENGTIDETKENIEPGTDHTVKYKCDEGFHLSSVKVDSEEKGIDDYPESYTFEKITAGEHSVAVVCTDVNAPDTGSIISSNYGTDNTTGGSVNIAAILVSSLVSIAGIALVFRFAKYSKATSFKK